LRKLRARVDRVRTIVAIREPAFLQGSAGTYALGNVISAGPSFTAGKCFAFLYPLLKHCQEPRSGVFNGFGLAPVHVLSSIASCHGPTMQQKDAQNHEQVTRKHG
jgi:hypothetical protein